MPPPNATTRSAATHVDALRISLGRVGLLLRGAFHPVTADGVPPLPDGRRAATLALIGNAGPAMWEHFSASPEAALPVSPLDRWTRRILSGIASEAGAFPVFPFGGPPYLPFVHWAKRAEPVRESPIGMLIHPEYGLWHAYRGALLFAEPLALPPRDDRPCPCDDCSGRPCLSACPVDAFTASGYDVDRCTTHIVTPLGTDCLSEGCRARRACPVGRAFVLSPAQAEFHMRAFLRGRSRGAGAQEPPGVAAGAPSFGSAFGGSAPSCERNCAIS